MIVQNGFQIGYRQAVSTHEVVQIHIFFHLDIHSILQHLPSNPKNTGAPDDLECHLRSVGDNGNGNWQFLGVLVGKASNEIWAIFCGRSAVFGSDFRDSSDASQPQWGNQMKPAEIGASTLLDINWSLIQLMKNYMGRLRFLTASCWVGITIISHSSAAKLTPTNHWFDSSNRFVVLWLRKCEVIGLYYRKCAISRRWE